MESKKKTKTCKKCKCQFRTPYAIDKCSVCVGSNQTKNGNRLN